MGAQASIAIELALVRALALIRLSQLVLVLPSLMMSDFKAHRGATMIFTLYIVVALWLVVILTLAIRRGTHRGWTAFADVGVLAGATWAVGMLSAPGEALGWANWTMAPIVGAAMMIAAFGTRSQTVLAVVVLSLAYSAGVWSDLDGPAEFAGLTGNMVSMAIFAVVALFVTRWLRVSAARTDRLALETITLRQEEAATQARFDERTHQYRILHDTVLSTLSLIARGGLDHRTPEVQRRCASEADFLRGMVSGAVDYVPTNLGAALAKVGHEPATFGLRVHQQFCNLPGDVPAPVVTSLMGAVREGLNNIVKHAGVSEAWLSATADEEGIITVTVSDTGVGFDPQSVKRGLGLNRSLLERIESIGGRVSIDSAHGTGTTVEMVWAP